MRKFIQLIKNNIGVIYATTLACYFIVGGYASKDYISLLIGLAVGLIWITVILFTKQAVRVPKNHILISYRKHHLRGTEQKPIFKFFPWVVLPISDIDYKLIPPEGTKEVFSVNIPTSDDSLDEDAFEKFHSKCPKCVNSEDPEDCYECSDCDALNPDGMLSAEMTLTLSQEAFAKCVIKDPYDWRKSLEYEIKYALNRDYQSEETHRSPEGTKVLIKKIKEFVFLDYERFDADLVETGVQIKIVFVPD